MDASQDIQQIRTTLFFCVVCFSSSFLFLLLPSISPCWFAKRKAFQTFTGKMCELQIKRIKREKKNETSHNSVIFGTLSLVVCRKVFCASVTLIRYTNSNFYTAPLAAPGLVLINYYYYFFCSYMEIWMDFQCWELETSSSVR